MEDSTYKIEKDSEGRVVFYGTACGNWWWKKEYDSEDNCIFYLDSTGFWVKKRFNDLREEIYYENSFGVCKGER